MEQIINAWYKNKEYQEILQNINTHHQKVTGLCTGAKICLLSSLYQQQPNSMLLVTTSTEKAVTLYENLTALLGDNVRFFPYLELMPFQINAGNSEIKNQRVQVLSDLSLGKKILVVAPMEACLRIISSPNNFQAHHLTLKVGKQFELLSLAGQLSAMGYSKETLVDIPGTFSIRGSIIDIYALNAPYPARVEFFDREIESIKYFNPTTQKSLEPCAELLVQPYNEMCFTTENLSQALQQFDQEVEQLLSKLTANPKKEAKQNFATIRELLTNGIWDNRMEQLTCLFYPEKNTVFNYLPNNNLIILDEENTTLQTMTNTIQDLSSNYYDLLSAGHILPSFLDNLATQTEITTIMKKHPLLGLCQLNEENILGDNISVSLHARELPIYKSNLTAITEDLQYFTKQDYQIIITASSTIRLNRIKEMMAELNFPGVNLILSKLNQGFESSSLKLVLITEKELLGQEAKNKSRRRPQIGEKIDNFLDLKTGDYVVHNSHGIGKYVGIERLEIDQNAKDYLLIEYAGTDKLYVPVEQVDLIQKYIGNEGNAPKLYKLNGTEWLKAKTKVKAAVENMAAELLALYGAREAMKGFAFSPDNNWQGEFEDAFEYTETPDQLQAIAEIKQDMEKIRPMDRILCGDVGYGKTEVAIRAAFKAVMDSKQVAILVPTTVLAQQHYTTLTERFANFPVKIGTLSRFVSPKEQKEVLKKLSLGTIDIVVGTHRLLSKDIEYKDLGLLIVDEEQRFGVAHKEKIKAMKENIDVLTLSATPIPRTLHMALVGMRDMSIINTPPEDRHPVQTYVLEYNDKLIKDAITREIQRGGQVYFIHNHISNIIQLADNISALVPEAEIAIAHGRMKEKELEDVMLDFIAGNTNVLISTTIIESGLDIPNVNTLIVNEADHFGLAQLYQLRGRVGRSHRQAFAYFTYRSNHIINDIAKKRLVAIRDFTELGSGFKIAMRDMEIRGAGNILGPEQHGHIAAVGFDMYCKLVEEEIQKQMGKEVVTEMPAPLLELGINAYLPDDYIADTDLKIEIYKRMSGAKNSEEITALAAEMQDRYGKLPLQAQSLLTLGEVKIYAQKYSVHSIIRKNQQIVIKFHPVHHLSGACLVELANQYGNVLTFSNKKDFCITINTSRIPADQGIPHLLRILKKLKNEEE